MKRLIPLLIPAIIMFFFSSCLTVEYKEYTFEINKDGSGKLTIQYVNIMSVLEDTLDLSQNDFDILINDYYLGDKIEGFYSNADSIDKRLYTSGGHLQGEIVVWFDDISDIRLLKRGKRDPYIFCLATTCEKERYVSSNGEYGSDDVPIISWKAKQDVLILKTAVLEDGFETITLSDHFEAWKHDHD